MALAIIPPVGILTILGYVGYGLYGGIFCAIEGYKHNICRGIISIWITIRNCDEFSNKYIFDKRCTCFPYCDDWCLKKEENNNSDENKEKVNDINSNNETKKDDDTKENLENKNDEKNIVGDDNKNNIVINEKNDNEEKMVVNEKKVNEENLEVECNEDIKEKLLDNDNKEKI